MRAIHHAARWLPSLPNRYILVPLLALLLRPVLITSLRAWAKKAGFCSYSENNTPTKIEHYSHYENEKSASRPQARSGFRFTKGFNRLTFLRDVAQRAAQANSWPPPPHPPTPASGASKGMQQVGAVVFRQIAEVLSLYAAVFVQIGQPLPAGDQTEPRLASARQVVEQGLETLGPQCAHQWPRGVLQRLDPIQHQQGARGRHRLREF